MNRLFFTAGLCCACRISGADVYSERSTDFWLDLIKAASLQGEAGNSSLMLVSSNLVRSLVNVARLLVGKSWVEYKQAHKMLKEAQQVHVYVLLGSRMRLRMCMCSHVVS